jgi:hypothetical protein
MYLSYCEWYMMVHGDFMLLGAYIETVGKVLYDRSCPVQVKFFYGLAARYYKGFSGARP